MAYTSVPPSLTFEVVVPPGPQAATTNGPAHASASARTRLTPCIRVLPLLTDDPAAFFPNRLGCGARVRRQQVLLSSLFGRNNSLAPCQTLSSMPYCGHPNDCLLLCRVARNRLS